MVCLYPLEAKGPKVPWWCVCIQVHFRLSFQFSFLSFLLTHSNTRSARVCISLAVRWNRAFLLSGFSPQIIHQSESELRKYESELPYLIVVIFDMKSKFNVMGDHFKSIYLLVNLNWA